ncbi:MAG: hypothetical protein LBK94_09155 [Prevotellaceae bacterium]|jgi:hypothetical protein|nr:hypothetical protein [Prevotellaceae bacterium]
MKKIYIIQILLLSIFLTGCSDSNYTDLEDSQVKIESADIAFNASGGTGEIVVAETDAFTAASDQNWCSLNISGKVIALTVEPNVSISGRTARITVKSGNKTNYVVVTQTLAKFYIESDDAGISGKGYEVRIPCETDVSLAVDTVYDSWLTASIDGNEIVLQATPNPSMENTRSTTITLAIRNQGNTVFTHNLNVTQGTNYLNYEDYLGTYTMYYSTTNTSSIPTRSLTVTLSVKSEGETYRLDGILADNSPGELLARFNANNGTVSLLGQIMHVYPDTQYDFWWLPYSDPTNGNYINRSTTAGMVAVDIDLSNGGLKFNMADNGVWGSRVVAGFMLRNYNGSTSMGNVNGKDGQPYYYYPSFDKQ